MEGSGEKIQLVGLLLCSSSACGWSALMCIKNLLYGMQLNLWCWNKFDRRGKLKMDWLRCPYMAKYELMNIN